MNKLTFALLLVGVFASACLARTSPQIRRPFKFTPGQTYIYEYRGRQWNGLTKLADQYAGLTIDCDVVLQALAESPASQDEVVMKLSDIQVEQLHTQALDKNDIRKLNAGQEVNARQLALYKEELSKPIRFTYANGKVVRFVAESRDAEWSINIKKSILSLFQLDLAPTRIIKSASKQMDEQINGYSPEDLIQQTSETPLVYPVYEESFGGICETHYEIDSVDNADEQRQKKQKQEEGYQGVEFPDVLNVTKTVNYKNCLTDPSVSYDRHSFKVSTQTIKGKLFGQQPSGSVASQNYHTVPEEIKQKYADAYSSFDQQGNVASATPVERHSYTKYNITTAPKWMVARPQVAADSSADMLLVEGVYSEAKVKYEADGDLIVSDTQQSLKLISCVPTGELAQAAPQAPIMSAQTPRQPTAEYQTIQCELTSQKLKFYQALWKYAQLKSSIGAGQGEQHALYSHNMALPFALSASWYPVVATGQMSGDLSIEQSLNPDQLAKSYETLLISLADDVLAEDVAQSKRAGEKVIRLVNIVAFMPGQKLVQVYDRIVERIQQAKQQQLQTRGKQAAVDNDEVAKWKVVRKLCLDSLPLAGSKQAVEMIELLIQSQRVQSWEARELVEAVPANLRYPDTEIIDAFVRMSQSGPVRKSRSLFASCSIAAGKMIGQAYAKSQDASYKPTTGERYTKLPVHLRDDEIVKQVVEEADPRRQLPIDWAEQDKQAMYERLVLDERDLAKYVQLYKQMLDKAANFHEKVIYLETLAHMKVPQVVAIFEPIVSGRLSLGQCLGSQPLDIGVPMEQWQRYSSQMHGRRAEQRAAAKNQDQRDWDEEESEGAEECNYVRTIAIYAMAHLSHWAPNKVQALLLPVFDNTYEPYQIRIAAFTTIMLTPVEEHVLERIASQMWREPSKEVASFVVGAIDTMSKLNTPAWQSYKKAAMRAAESMPKQYLDSYKHSWLAGGDHFNGQKESGMSWIAEVIKSNVSSVPRAAYWRSGRTHGPAGSKFDNHFELGFTSKGLEGLIKSYVAYNKQQPQDQTNLVASILETLYESKDDIVRYYHETRDQMKSAILGDQQQKLAKEPFVANYFYKRQQPIDGVNSRQGKQARQPGDLFEGNQRSKRSTVTFQARASKDDDEAPKLTVFSKIFDSTSYQALGQRELVQLIDAADAYLKAAADELVLGGKLHYVKMLMPSNMWHVVPSQMGLPIVVTHRTPIVASIKVDGSHNGQLTSSKLSQYLRQQAQRAPATQGQNFAAEDSLNITAIVHPKIMLSNQRFMFAVEQANSEAYGVQTEKAQQISLPIEVSVAYSFDKQLVSITAQPKTPARMAWRKEAAKTFIGQLALASSQPDQWLGQEHLVRVPSKQAQYEREQRAAHFVPSLLASAASLLNEPREQQQKAIDDLETPYKFEQHAASQQLGLECQVEGATDDEDVARAVSKPQLVSTKSFSPLQWSATDEIDQLDEHRKSGPLGAYLHLADSATNRPTKYLEFYTTLKPDQPHKAPIYRVNFQLDAKAVGGKRAAYGKAFQAESPRRTSEGRLEARNWAEQQQQLSQISRQQNMVEVY